MDDLIAFLRARLDEDETSVISGDCKCGDVQRPDCADRVLADVEVKRQIITEHEPIGEVSGTFCSRCSQDEEQPPPVGWWIPFPCRTLRLLALPYAGHPDYDESWRP